MADRKDCCQKQETKFSLKKGIIYGILPHSFCLGFLIFSVLGASTLTAFFRRWLLTSYFFPLLVFLSLILASLSAMIFLKRNQALSWEGVKQKNRYLTFLYLTVIGINLLFFLVIFPLTANWGYSQKIKSAASEPAALSSKKLQVEIPCPGHAPLIIEELEKVDGLVAVKFELPNFFQINYDSQKTNLSKIMNLEIFKTFKAKEL